MTIDLHDEVHTLSLELIGAHNSAHPPVETPNTPWTMTRHVELFLDWQAAGALDVRPLISHRYPWRQTPDAYQIPDASAADRAAIAGLVQKCLDARGVDCETWEREINARVAALYGL